MVHGTLNKMTNNVTGPIGRYGGRNPLMSGEVAGEPGCPISRGPGQTMAGEVQQEVAGDAGWLGCRPRHLREKKKAVNAGEGIRRDVSDSRCMLG